MNDENLFDAELFTQWTDALAPVQPPAGLRERIMARVRTEHPLTQLRTIRSAEGWMDFGPGIRFKILHRDENGRANSLLARLEAGVTLPPHLHAANEECLVLEGEITFADITVRAGDYHFAPKGAAHTALTTRTGAFIFLRSGMGEPVPEYSAAR
ncbi:MAG: cupin domain-containing protein [Gammaproteobacteria bacterium]